MSFSSTLSTQANSPSNAQAAAIYNSLLHRFPVLTLLSDDLLALFWRTLNLHTESWTSVLNAQTVFTSVHQLGKVAFPNYDPKKKNHPHTVAKDSTKFLFKAMFVLIFIERNLSAFLSAEEFVEKYPQFCTLKREEILHWLNFCNVMRAAIPAIAMGKADYNKGLLLEVAGRLTGRVYKTGGGQTPDANRAVKIFEVEGGVTKKASQKYTVNPKQPSDQAKGKRKSSMMSESNDSDSASVSDISVGSGFSSSVLDMPKQKRARVSSPASVPSSSSSSAESTTISLTSSAELHFDWGDEFDEFDFEGGFGADSSVFPALDDVFDFNPDEIDLL